MTYPEEDRSRRDAALRRLAARQHGLIRRQQALAVGMSDSGIHRRLQSGEWVRCFRSVYALAGAPRTFEQRALGACLAVGRGAAASHLTAARLWGFHDDGSVLHVTVIGSVATKPPGVVVHRTSTLRARDVGRLRGIPVTSPVRTVLALAGSLPEKELDEIVQAAVFSGCVDARELKMRARTEAGRGKRGPALLRRLLPETGRDSHVSSALEDLTERALARCALPRPRREYPVVAEGRVFYVDFAFPEARVAVEADGRRWHSDPAAYERDRMKSNALTAAGWRILRVTEKQLRSAPTHLCDQIRELVGIAPGKRE